MTNIDKNYTGVASQVFEGHAADTARRSCLKSCNSSSACAEKSCCQNGASGARQAVERGATEDTRRNSLVFGNPSSVKHYHKKDIGKALQTVERHASAVDKVSPRSCCNLFTKTNAEKHGEDLQKKIERRAAADDATPQSCKSCNSSAAPDVHAQYQNNGNGKDVQQKIEGHATDEATPLSCLESCNSSTAADADTQYQNGCTDEEKIERSATNEAAPESCAESCNSPATVDAPAQYQSSCTGETLQNTKRHSTGEDAGRSCAASCHSSTTAGAEKPYHKRCTGEALQTVQRNATRAEVTLFAACFCPFVQRAWIALEYLGIPYKVREVDPFQKPQELLDLSPKGLVPALKLNNYNPPRALNESTVVMEFLENLASTSTKRTLFPPASDPYAQALVRLQGDHVNRAIVPAFYRYLQAQDPATQLAGETEFSTALDTLVGLFERAEREVGGTGLWTEGGELGWADAMVAPWMFAAAKVLTYYRGYEMPRGTKVRAWLDRLFEHPAVRGTCSTDELYIDTYERNAFNRPNLCMAAKAANARRDLP